MEEIDNNMVLSKPKHKTIEERIAEYAEEYECNEDDSSDIKGKEIW
jgi:hypothetical protein